MELFDGRLELRDVQDLPSEVHLQLLQRRLAAQTVHRLLRHIAIEVLLQVNGPKLIRLLLRFKLESLELLKSKEKGAATRQGATQTWKNCRMFSS